MIGELETCMREACVTEMLLLLCTEKRCEHHDAVLKLLLLTDDCMLMM